MLDIVSLTRREREVLGYLESGATNGEIAERLTLSVETVRTHVKSIRRKLGIPGRPRARSRLPPSLAKIPPMGDSVAPADEYPEDGRSSSYPLHRRFQLPIPMAGLLVIVVVAATSRWRISMRHISVLVLLAVVAVTAVTAYAKYASFMLGSDGEPALAAAIEGQGPKVSGIPTENTRGQSRPPRTGTFDNLRIPAATVEVDVSGLRLKPTLGSRRVMSFDEMKGHLGDLFLPSYMPEGLLIHERWVSGRRGYLSFLGEGPGAYLRIVQDDFEPGYTYTSDRWTLEQISVGDVVGTLARRHDSGYRVLLFQRGDRWIWINALGGGGLPNSELSAVAASLVKH